MCLENQLPEMAGLHARHLPILQAANPMQAEITACLYRALTENLNPHLPALPAFMAMVEALKAGDFGVLAEHRLVRLPLSIIGTDKVRYRTEAVDWLHETILSVRMSDITVEAVRQALRPHGLCILFLCSCGVVMGRCEDNKAYYGSDNHRRMDRLRSAVDAAGNPVQSVDSFGDIQVPTMDLHADGAEERLFVRIEQLTRLAATAGHRDYSWLDAELAHFTAKAQPILAAA
jgi:hypothetical protein